MREVLIVAGQELAANLRRPGYILMTLLIPVLGALALLLASLFGGQMGSFVADQFAPAQAIVGYVDQAGVLRPELPGYEGQLAAYPDEEAARRALLAKEIASFFMLPPDYMATGKVVVVGRGGGFSSLMAADNALIGQFVLDSLLAGRVDASVQARARQPVNIVPVTLDANGELKPENPFSWLGDFVIPYLFSILFVMTIFTTSGFLLQGVSEEKEGRIIEVLLSSISPTQLMAGKILGLGALGLIQVIIWVASGAVLLAATAAVFAVAGLVTIPLSTVILAVVFFMLGYLLFATLMAVAGSMGTSMREGQQIASIFSLSAALPFMAINVLFTNPDSPIVLALSYFPLTSPVMMLLRLGFGTVPPAQVAISLALLVVGLAVSLWAGAKIFRVGLLMYGKRPGLNELARAFKQA